LSGKRMFEDYDDYEKYIKALEEERDEWRKKAEEQRNIVRELMDFRWNDLKYILEEVEHGRYRTQEEVLFEVMKDFDKKMGLATEKTKDTRQ
jgi:hypothetical protein